VESPKTIAARTRKSVASIPPWHDAAGESIPESLPRRGGLSLAAYLWAGLHGRVALGDAIPTFPWPNEDEYIERMIEIHITAR
jgi:hypothetical protein